MFTANSRWYQIGSLINDRVVTLVDRKDGTHVYTEMCKYFDIDTGVALIFKGGRWMLTNASAKRNPKVDVQQILERAKAGVR